MAAIAAEAAGFALDEGRVGEERGGNRLQGHGDAHLADHVGFRVEIQIDLDGAGAGHHVEAEAAARRHIAAHDCVAALGHPRDRLARCIGTETHAVEPDPELFGNRPHLIQMRVHLVAGAVQVMERGARELELAARLQRHRLAVLEQGDGVAFLQVGSPAVALKPFKQGADAPRPLVGERRVIGEAMAEFLVLRADPPRLARLAAGFEIGDQVAAGERLALPGGAIVHVPSQRLRRTSAGFPRFERHCPAYPAACPT